MNAPSADVEALSRAITGRQESVFQPAMRELDSELREIYSGSRVLITGGAGFIAGQALRVLLPFGPARVVVADTNENGLAEIVRDLRVEGTIPDNCVFEPRLVDITTPLSSRMIREEGPFDVVLAFAAAKHVRSERDAVSALHMLNININGTLRAVTDVRNANSECRVFVVSTDKAADPASFMGASKRVMEMAVLGTISDATTTRFANVAFSSGSLLESWLIRLGRNQILPVPADTERFFVSPHEAGQLCVAASAAPAGTVAVPAEDAVESVELTTALKKVLATLGEECDYYTSVDEMPANNAIDLRRSALITPRDTAGEKSAEVFVGAGEARSSWLPAIDSVTSTFDAGPALGLGEWVDTAVHGATMPSLVDIGAALSSCLTAFAHVPSERRLDDRI